MKLALFFPARGEPSPLERVHSIKRRPGAARFLPCNRMNTYGFPMNGLQQNRAEQGNRLPTGENPKTERRRLPTLCSTLSSSPLFKTRFSPTPS